MLWALNILFFVIHDAIIVVNLLGWIFPATRKFQRLTLACTLFSWLVMGAWYGWGYCACTDWHFQVRRKLGILGTESSFSQLLLKQLTGQDITRQVSDTVTLTLMIIIMIGTCTMWYRDVRASASQARTGSASAQHNHGDSNARS